MREVGTGHTPETLVTQLGRAPGIVLLQSARSDPGQGRYSLVAARPILTFRSFGIQCETWAGDHRELQYGNPWQILDALMTRFEVLDEVDLPFPLGGAFGFIGFGMKHFVEPRLPRGAVNDLPLPDCHLGFYGSLVVFDHALHKTWVIATGLAIDGSREDSVAREELRYWAGILESGEGPALGVTVPERSGNLPLVKSNLTEAQFVRMVERAQQYIRAGHIYQVNLSQRLESPSYDSAWTLYQDLTAVSPAPFAAYLAIRDCEIVSSSPELFLRLTGSRIVTRPIKGTRPRSLDPVQDTQLGYELQTSSKELAELVMITDLLRNDLGRVCEYGTVQVPELVRLERYSHVQHLVSSVEGRLRDDVTHLGALAACFPGGSITGAPKIRALEIIDELEPVARGPYTGVTGYFGFNRESQWSILIRTAVVHSRTAFFQVGAGIVADSNPKAEYDETLAKGRGFFDALRRRAGTQQATGAWPDQLSHVWANLTSSS